MADRLTYMVDNSLDKAIKYTESGHIVNAYAHYTVVAEFSPQKRPQIEKQFTDVLCQLGILFTERNKLKEVLQCYKRSLNLFPNNTRMLCNFSAHLLRIEKYEEAIPYLKRALDIDPLFLPAERNLQNAYSMAVARWHFPMLNDRTRNDAFKNAIRKYVKKGYNTVLDIGTGTGIFSMYAKDAGAKKVYACECSSTMIKVTQKVLQNNNATDIMLIPKNSTDIQIPHDLHERVKLIVTETFDAGLFGELVIPTLIDAHMRLLTNDGTGIIIPKSATLYVAIANCEYLRYKSSVDFNSLKSVCPLNFEGILILSDDKYYDTENLQYVDFNYVTKPQVAIKINFNDLEELQNLIKDGIKSETKVICRYDCTIDSIISWFKLHLDDEIIIDSSENGSCWQYAIFPTKPNTCCQGDELRITTKMTDGKLQCSYRESNINHLEENKLIYYLPKEIIIFLNDFNYCSHLCNVAVQNENSKFRCVLDTSPFPIYGLMLSKYNDFVEKLFFVTSNTNLQSLVLKIAEINNIVRKIRIVEKYDDITCPVDSIFVHNFDTKGELKDWGQESYNEFFRFLMKETTALFPKGIYIMGQLIYSEDLNIMSSVNDSNFKKTSSSTFCFGSSMYNSGNSSAKETNENENYKIADFINEFKIDQIFDLNSSTFMYEALSDTYKIAEIVSGVNETVKKFRNVQPTNNGYLPNALLCWYKINLTPNNSYETNGKGCFMNQMAVVFEKNLIDKMVTNDTLKVKVYQMNGLIKITISIK